MPIRFKEVLIFPLKSSPNCKQNRNICDVLSINVSTADIQMTNMIQTSSQYSPQFLGNLYLKYLHVLYLSVITQIILFQSSWICPQINWRSKKTNNLQKRRRKCVLIMMTNHNRTSLVSIANHIHTFAWYVYLSIHIYSLCCSFFPVYAFLFGVRILNISGRLW